MAIRQRKTSTTPAAAEAAPAIVSFAEALAESGQTVDELRDSLPVREPGSSNLAQTIRAHRSNYRTRTRPDGKATQDNGDVVATALLWATLDELKDFSALRFDGKRYDHLNAGHARMCVGNLLRAQAAKGDTGVLEFLTTLANRAPKEA